MMKRAVSGTGVYNEHRLATLHRLSILDSPTEPAFDRFTQLVTRLLGVPIAMISLVDAQRQFFKSSIGLAEPWASYRETPLSHSFCQYTVETDKPLIVSDALTHPLVHNNPGIQALDMYAYLGIPLTTADGMVLGALCAIDTQPHQWHAADIDLMHDLAAALMAEIELRLDIIARQQAEAALYESNARFAAAFKLASIGMVLVDLEGRCLQVNPTFCSLIGYSEQELITRAIREFTHPEDLGIDENNIQQIMSGELTSYQVQKRYIHKQGRIVWVEVHVALVRNMRGLPHYFVAEIQDITQRQQREYERQRLIEQLTDVLDAQETLLRQSSEALQRTEVLYDVAGALNRTLAIPAILHTVVESAAKVLPAYRTVLITIDMATQTVLQQIEGGPGAMQLPPPSFAELWDGLSGAVLRKGRPVLSLNDVPDGRESKAVQQRRIHDKSGSILVAPIQSQGTILGTLTAINCIGGRDFNNSDLELLVTLANHAAVAIERSTLLNELQYNATTDGLTQLLNRRTWFEQSQRIAEIAEHSEKALSVVLLDIDHFKQINDSYGHAVGDAALQAISQIIEHNVRKIDVLGRYGGEEFVILLPDTDILTAYHIAERIRKAVDSHCFVIDPHQLAITLSLGIATMQGRPLDITVLLMQADQALYEAKHTGRNRTCMIPINR